MQQVEPKVNSANVIAEEQIENKGEILKKMIENNSV